MRPKDDEGRLLPPPCKRLPDVPQLHQAAVYALAQDARFAHLTMSRRTALADRAINHVVDGDAPPLDDLPEGREPARQQGYGGRVADHGRGGPRRPWAATRRNWQDGGLSA